jgi:hypothetical protein
MVILKRKRQNRERVKRLEAVAQAAWALVHARGSRTYHRCWANLADALADLLDTGWEPEPPRAPPAGQENT